ncbi:hypothetical protein O6P37_24875 [Mycobacterium sp. CPCC 205372]|uniref:Uncharacterized protein n=1 Tax=Mycobacterium hippophais TaxID=3016340 RepID=A0ABT4PZU4_9MYCO|nr:hypothetical protein [Mycobacterium hippophais]MCZ8382106.1 hypothetical protein [Mycobacterium hippophais]
MAEPARASADGYADALAFEAPYLIEKLVKDHVAESVDHAELLFREIKRYFVVTECDAGVTWSMYSLEVDAVWHQFVLFTRQYIDYCRAHFRGYIQHAPSNAPKIRLAAVREPSTFEMFAQRYAQLFDESLPDVWYDDRNVTLARRILFSRADDLTLRDGDDGMVELLDSHGEPIFAVDPVARAALEFMADVRHFFVRELPGDLDDDQRIALVSVMVENRILALAA